ncbi:Uncharacterised protein [Acinetobacter baumannii]|nr:Uncharacterised protein [Acinetobacter baumannii]
MGTLVVSLSTKMQVLNIHRVPVYAVINTDTSAVPLTLPSRSAEIELPYMLKDKLGPFLDDLKLSRTQCRELSIRGSLKFSTTEEPGWAYDLELIYIKTQ